MKGDLSSGNVFESGATLLFSGQQQIWTVDGPINLSRLQIAQEGSEPSVSIQSSAGPSVLTISDNVNLVNGIVDLRENVLKLPGTVGFTRNVASGTQSHFVGSVIHNMPGGSTGSFVFPVGSQNDYKPLSLTFSTPLISATELMVQHVSHSSSARQGLPLTAPGGQIVVDSAPFEWSLVSSVNFAQSQPVDLTVEVDGALAGPAEQHRLIQRAATSSPALGMPFLARRLVRQVSPAF